MYKTLKTVPGTDKSSIKQQEVKGDFWVHWSEYGLRKSI